MSNFVTIQKLCEDVGIEDTSVNNLLRKGILTPYSMDGFRRIFINLDEFYSKIKPKNNTTSDGEDIDLEKFLI